MGILAGIKALFGIAGVTETALKVVDRIAGTDWTPDKKAEWILKYQEATKHQSPMRRMIAFCICLVWVSLCFGWFAATVVGRFMYDEVLNPGTALASDISAFMDLNINEGFALLLAFYFGSAIVNGLRKGG